jgi:hypothetical protein
MKKKRREIVERPPTHFPTKTKGEGEGEGEKVDADG